MAPHPHLLLDLINACHGWDKDLDWLNSLYLEMIHLEQGFNIRAGFTMQDNRFNEAFTERPLPELGTVFDVPDEELDRILEFVDRLDD